MQNPGPRLCCALIGFLMGFLMARADAGENHGRQARSTASVSGVAERNPVLLIHGIKDDARKMERMALYLRSHGWDATTLSLRPSWGQLGLDELAQQLARFADATYPSGTKFDLVAFSMGGLVSRYYLQRLGGVERVERFVTLSTPHHGTALAWLIPNRGCRQMRPGSAFLRDLNRDDGQLARLQFTSLWTPLDLVILPARSSEVPGARNIKTWVTLHPLMVVQPSCLRAVADALRREMPAAAKL